MSQEPICIYKSTFNIPFNAYSHSFILFIWRNRKMEMASLSFPFSFFLWFPFLIVQTTASPPPPPQNLMATILAGIRDKWEVEKKNKQFFMR